MEAAHTAARLDRVAPTAQGQALELFTPSRRDHHRRRLPQPRAIILCELGLTHIVQSGLKLRFKCLPSFLVDLSCGTVFVELVPRTATNKLLMHDKPGAGVYVADVAITINASMHLSRRVSKCRYVTPLPAPTANAIS